MFGNVKEIIVLLNELNLSNEEFYFLYLIHKYNVDKKLHDTKFTKEFELYYEKNKNKYNYYKFLQKYEEAGYIINVNKGEEVFFNKISVTDRFKSIFIIDIDECWEEVKRLYPKKILVGNNYIFAQSSSHKDLKKDYYNLITKGGDKQLHYKFLAAIDLFYNGDTNSSDKAGAMKLEKFIYSFDELAPVIFDELDNPNQIKIWS